MGTLAIPWAFFEMKQPNLSYVTVEADPTLEFQVFFDHESVRASTAFCSWPSACVGS